MGIICAAIKLTTPGGVVVFSLPRPNRHCDILMMLPRDYYKLGECVQGFLAHAGEFVTREQAYKIAEEFGQLLPEDYLHSVGCCRTPGTLYSEDLW